MNRMLSLFVLLAAVEAGAQDEAAGPLEEVVVRVERPLGVLRAEAVVAEHALYEAFNSVLGDTDYEIQCYEYTPTGSHLEQDICEPAFVRELRRRGTQRAFDFGGVDFASGNIDFGLLRTTGDAGFEIDTEATRMLDAMVTAVNENPAVRRAFIDYMRKQQVLRLALEPAPRRRRAR